MHVEAAAADRRHVRAHEVVALLGHPRDVAAAAIDASTNPDVRAVLVTGDGRAFCAGGDVKAMATGGMFEEGESPLVGGMNGAAELHRAVAGRAAENL